MSHKPVFVIKLTPTPGHRAPVISRLKALLKFALRSLGLRCIGARQEPCFCDICSSKEGKR